MLYLPVELARQLGHYEQEGVDVEIQPVGSGSRALQALLGGSADVGFALHEQVIQMAALGKEMETITLITRLPGFAIVVSPATRRTIKGIKDLKGTVVGVTNPGTGTHNFVKYLLARHGMSPSDVNVIGTGDTLAARLGALERGVVDAAVLPEPAISQCVKRYPHALILADTRSDSGMAAVTGFSSYAGAAVFSTSTWIRRNPDAARRLSRALQRALRWIQDHSPEEIAQMMPESFMPEDKGTYIEALRSSRPMYSPDGRTTPEAAAGTAAILAIALPDQGVSGVDISKTYTNAFLDQ